MSSISTTGGANPFVDSAQRVSCVKRIHTGVPQYDVEFLRLGLISFPYDDLGFVTEEIMTSSPFATPAGFVLDQPKLVKEVGDAEALRGQLEGLYDRAPRVRFLRSASSITKERFLHTLDQALERNASIVCCSELGFPIGDGGLCDETAQETQQRAEEHNCLIVAGSAHCRASLYNSSPTFFPQNKEGVNPAEKSGRADYHKQVSAVHGAGEIVQTPPIRFSHQYIFRGLKIGVLVCSDLLDYTTVSAHIKSGNMLLVPCWSTQLSKLGRVGNAVNLTMRGPVVLVNCNSEHRPHVDAKSVQLYRSVPRGFDQPIQFVEEQNVDGAKIEYWDISIRALYSLKLSRPSEATRALQWLFGFEPYTQIPQSEA